MNDHRTKIALSEELVRKLSKTSFCIIGCGGIGANFAELLVRTGAKKIILVDGDTVKATDLNRIWSFARNDAQLNTNKAKALKGRLEEIVGDGNQIEAIEDHFRDSSQIVSTRESAWKAHRAVYRSTVDIVFVAVDRNNTRRSIESLTQDKDTLSCGVMIDEEIGKFEFECTWNPETPVETEAEQDYGPNNGSYSAIVAEATSVAFSMLLNHLKEGEEKLISYNKEYDSNFLPVRINIETSERSIYTTQ